MTGDQMFFLGVAFVVIAVITLVAQFKWLRDGRVKTTLVFLSGVMAMVALRIAGLPPTWFFGSKTGFALGLSLAVSGLVARAGEERSFGLPFLTGLGGTLVVINAVDAVARAL